MDTGEVIGRGLLSPQQGWIPHPVPQAPSVCTPTPDVTLTSAHRDPGDVSPAVTTAAGAGMQVEKCGEGWKPVVRGEGWVASVVGWWTSWASGHIPLCRAS